MEALADQDAARHIADADNDADNSSSDVLCGAVPLNGDACDLDSGASDDVGVDAGVGDNNSNVDVKRKRERDRHSAMSAC